MDATAPKLSTLAPQYSFESHGVYFTILKATIEGNPEVRNIALAGSYGAGKSSILRQVASEFGERVVEVSLLTLGAQPQATPPGDEQNPAATTTTNRIQKEIVKQLLYQQDPTRSLESRFRRIVRFRWRSELILAGVFALIAVVLALLAGLDVVVNPSLGLTFSDRPHFVAVIAMFAAIGLLAAGFTLLIRALIRGRIGIERVAAGPATITLPTRSTSYFDEYLDEIIYFFETNPSRDIVIIEDLDRFNDPNIFESLRSLNGILNAAEQLQKRDFRFIYAVRDSVFEKLGRDDLAADSDEARSELVRANRTKFFELVVPVVPFITHRNARDLMSRELSARKHKISKDLIDLAARHLADMRLIHNVLNEYEVFKHRLLDVTTPVPDLDPDRLFAMILFKNAHMAEFEKIRHGSSKLDDLWDVSRALVRTNADALRKKNRVLRARIATGSAAREYAQKLAEAVTSRIESLATAPGSGLASSALQYNGVELTAKRLASVEFWRDFAEGDDPITVQAQWTGYSRHQTMQMSVASIERLAGMPVDSARFAAVDTSSTEATIAANEQAIADLERLTWQQLANASGYTYALPADANPRDFRAWVHSTVPSRLAADLVIHGFITSYFPLYVSSFYGTVVRPNAMTYVMRFVDHRQGDPDFKLDADDVDSILWSEGLSVLSEESMFNIHIVDHLLTSRLEDARTVVATVTSAGPTGMEFIDRYLESGASVEALVELLSPRLPEIFVHLATTPAVDTAQRRLALIDIAIAHRADDVAYATSDELRGLMRSGYREVGSLAPGASIERAGDAVEFISAVGVVLPDLRGLPEGAIAALRPGKSYELNLANLEVLADGVDISLDALHKADPAIFDYVASEPAQYVRALRESEHTEHSVSATDHLYAYLQKSVATDLDASEEIVAEASPECLFEDITELASPIWPALVRCRHATMTFGNVDAYVEEFGVVDDDLAQSLVGVDEISDESGAPEERRVAVALALINSPSEELRVGVRIKLTESLNVGELAAENVAPQPGTLVGELIRSGIIADDEDAFDRRLMVDWDTQAHAIRASKEFAEFVSPKSLAPEFVAPLLRDTSLARVHFPVVRTFGEYATLPRSAHEAYAERALAGAFSPNAGGIQRARTGGLSVDMTLRLMAMYMDRLDGEEVRDIVRTLGTPWKKFADHGFGTSTAVDDSPHARIVLGALEAAGVVSQFPLKEGKLHVSRRQK